MINSQVLIKTENLRKEYGNTIAVNNLSFSIKSHEVIGLVGANGAGKSTLMRIISGVTTPESGKISIGGNQITWADYNPAIAGKLGVRVVYQELSLCTNLLVYENFYVEQAKLFKNRLFWREKAIRETKKHLDRIFPDNGINVNSKLGNLSIAHKQIVEIARAVADPELKILILDEPTSSLGNKETQQLIDFVKTEKELGTSFVFISHRLNEIMQISDRIYIMQNGSKKWSGLNDTLKEEDLILKMGGSVLKEESHLPEKNINTKLEDRYIKQERDIFLKIKNLNTERLNGINIDIKSGSIVGIAGLAGSGQQELLKEAFQPRHKNKKNISSSGKLAYVSGDRKIDGIFPLWSIKKNMLMTQVASKSFFGNPSTVSEEKKVSYWYKRLKVVSSGEDAIITDLSGGNQQKILLARALVAEADIIFLDDPTKGVDIPTKQQLYKIFQEAASHGKIVIWYSTEDEEFSICNHVFVMRYGEIISFLHDKEINKSSIIKASFGGIEKKDKEINKTQYNFDFTRIVLPIFTMLVVYSISGLYSNGRVFSRFGIELLLGGAIPLVLASLAQVFIIGMSHVDLGVGNFMGLINVMSATLLITSPSKGVFSLLGALILYGLMGVLIYKRKLPAIIVTMGASFIWTGIAYILMDTPGGSCPSWLYAIFNFKFPVIPWQIVLVSIFGGLALILYRSRYGTILRGFGNNPRSMTRSGHSQFKAFLIAYLIAGMFALFGGLSVTAITTAADANATVSYTLLSIASVVLGGGLLTGGDVSPIGAVFGAITLSLIGALLGFVGLSSNYTAAVQGLILLLVLTLRLLSRKRI